MLPSGGIARFDGTMLLSLACCIALFAKENTFPQCTDVVHPVQFKNHPSV